MPEINKDMMAAGMANAAIGEEIENNAEMSDVEINAVAEAVAAGAPDSALEDAAAKAAKDHEDEEGVETFNKDPETGIEDIEVVEKEALPDTDASITEVMDGKVEENNQESFEAAAKENATAMFDLSDADCAQLINVMNRFKQNPNMNVMKELPTSMQEKIRGLAAGAGVPGNQIGAFAKVVLDEFIKEAMMDQEYVDLMTSIEKEFELPSIIDMYSEHVKETMEEKLLETADKIEEEAPDKAHMLREVSKAFTESYTYEKMMECYKGNRQIRKACKHPEKLSRICQDFNFRLENSKFKISDVGSVHPVLVRIFEGDDTITSEDLAKFVIMFCKTFEFHCNKDGLVDIAFAYYTIKNIISIDFAYDKKTEFTQTIINNIRKVISFIHENTL